jgi:host factor-I protein
MKTGPDRIQNPAIENGNEDQFVNRKLIRPTRTDGSGAAVAPALSEPVRTRPLTGKRLQPAADHTHAENFYFQKQMQSRTLLTIVLKNGETIHGTIEWFDKNCLKLARTGRPNLLIYKPAIRYLHKTDEPGSKE